MSVTTPAVGYADAMARIQQIQSQMTSVETAFDPKAAATAAATAATTASGSLTGGSSSSSFSSALAGAMGTTAMSDTAGATTTEATAALPANAASMLTSNQQQFASRLASDTGLDPGVVSAWVLAEESGAAATSRQSAGNNDWLNIGYTDSGTFSSGDSVWSDPTQAADATAGWLKGQNTIPGYGTASSGIQSILSAAGQPASTQIAALQSSGWASSGYTSLPGLYQQLAG